MLMLGIGNSVGYGVMIAYLQMISAKNDRTLQFTQFVVFIQAVPIIGRFINATFLIKKVHYLRIFQVMIGQLFAYLLLIIAMIAGSSPIAMPLATSACIIFMFCRAIGESTIVGFMKALPQELIATYGTGTGLSDCFATGVMLTMVNFGIGWSYYFLFVSLCLVPVYFNCFIWFESVRQDHA